MKANFNTEDPYGNLLSIFFQQSFPKVSHHHVKDEDLLEILTNIILGTKEVRYGPIPLPEALVEIRKAIRSAITDKKPIPILVPWGSIKANFSASLDIAEIMALQRLICLKDSIMDIYPQGVEMVIRIEDQSGYHLFSLEGNIAEISKKIDMYSIDLMDAIKILNPADSIKGILESTMPNAKSFVQVSAQNTEILFNYLMQSNPVIENHPDQIKLLSTYKVLVENGWKGIIPYEQRQFYLNQYRKLYVDWSEEKMLMRLALYFADSLTRSQLSMTGKQDHWDKFIQLAFTPPIKGLPMGYNYNYVYYRTLPMSLSRTHMAPWRAKGYFKVHGNHLTPKLTTFGNIEVVSQLIPSMVQITDDTNTVNIKTDYLLEDIVY